MADSGKPKFFPDIDLSFIIISIYPSPIPSVFLVDDYKKPQNHSGINRDDCHTNIRVLWCAKGKMKSGKNATAQSR